MKTKIALLLAATLALSADFASSILLMQEEEEEEVIIPKGFPTNGTQEQEWAERAKKPQDLGWFQSAAY